MDNLDEGLRSQKVRLISSETKQQRSIKKLRRVTSNDEKTNGLLSSD